MFIVTELQAPAGLVATFVFSLFASMYLLIAGRSGNQSHVNSATAGGQCGEVRDCRAEYTDSDDIVSWPHRQMLLGPSWSCPTSLKETASSSQSPRASIPP